MEFSRVRWAAGFAVSHRDRAGTVVVSGAVWPDRNVDDLHGCGTVIPRQRFRGRLDSET